MIVITTPTGNIGSKVLSALLNFHEPLRVIVRDASKLPTGVAEKVDVIEGSHGDADVVALAFDGARAVFWLPPGNPKATDIEDNYAIFSQPAATLLADSSVDQVVTMSALGRGWDRPAGNVTASLAMDDVLAKSGVALRALACASLMENVLRQVPVIRDRGAYFWPTPADAMTRQVASEDVARVAARLLLDPSWRGREEVPLIGPEDITHRHMMEIASDVTGHEIIYHEMTMAELEKMMVGRGASVGIAEAMVEMMTAKNEGIDELVERTSSLSAETPTTFRTWCEQVLRPALG